MLNAADKVTYVKKPAADFFYTKYLKALKGSYNTSTFGGKYYTADMDLHYKFGAQLSYDLGYVDAKPQAYSNSNWRRVRIYVKGNMFDTRLLYELEYSFTGSNNYKDIYLGYQDELKKYNLTYRVKAGNIKIPFSLEGYSSSKNITFMERALNEIFVENRKIGLELLLRQQRNKQYINFFTALFTNSLNEQSSQDPDTKGFAARLTYAYKFNKKHLLSLGTSMMYTKLQKSTLKYSQESESSIITDKYVSVKINEVDNILKNNLEALYIHNAYSLQGEFSHAALHSTTQGRYNFNAYYLEGSYFLFGKGRRYDFKDATLSKVKPNSSTSLEAAFRYSYISLNSRDEHGGEQSDYTFALNWYISKELKMMFNYIIAQPKQTDDYDGLLQIYQTRLLFAF